MITQPNDAQVTLDDLNNRITMAEAELKRLKKLAISEEYTVGELVKQKQYLEETILSLNDKIGSLEVCISGLKLDEDNIRKLSSDVHKREEAVVVGENTIRVALEDLNRRESELSEKSSKVYFDVEEKESALKELDASVKQRANDIVTVVESIAKFSEGLLAKVNSIGK